MKHALPPLIYQYAALEPAIDAHTLMLHHDVHHAAYVNALNRALEKVPELQEKTALWLLLNPSMIPRSIRTAVRNNAGGHVNHSLFWRTMSPRGGGWPRGPLAKAIGHDFGSVEQFKEEFTEAGSKQFGSGWVWLVKPQRRGGKLEIVTTAGHEHPSTQGQVPILLNDVWEHAYYLRYENRRAEYLKNWWTVVNWDEASHRFEHIDNIAESRRDVQRESVSAAAK
jgi:superoxide dismutase, Fe-Mn family